MSKKKAAQELGRLGGKSKSMAKSAAARENGKKGGKPKKVLTMFGGRVEDINSTKYINMMVFRDAMDSLPDGAFFAAAQEQGFDVEDWGWFSEVTQLNS